MKKLSIIVAAYNVENYIKECIDSVLNLQIFGEYEIIVINDGSTDNTLNEIKKIKKELIRVISIENSGISNVRNLGIYEAKGEYIYFVDGDDLINKTDFENLSSKLSLGYDIVMGGFNTFNDKKTLKPITKFFLGKTEGTGIEILNDYFFTEFETSVWRAFYKKDNIINNEIFFTKGIIVAEDAEWLLKLMIISGCVYFDNTNKIYNYRLRDGSVMRSSFTNKKFNDLIAVAGNIKEFMLKNKLDIKHEQKLNYYILVLIVSSLIRKNNKINDEDYVKVKKILYQLEFLNLKMKISSFFLKKFTYISINLLKLKYKVNHN